MNINSLLNCTDFSLNRPLNYYSSSRDDEMKVEDVDEDDQALTNEYFRYSLIII